MRGKLVPRTWKWNPILHAPPRYRRACAYDAFIPSDLVGTDFKLSAGVAATIAEAEKAILALNADADAASLVPLARLLLRTESIASSKIEGLQVGIRQLARAQSKLETAGGVSASVREVLGNIDAMQLAVDEAAAATAIDQDHLIRIHSTLMESAPNSHIAGRIRKEQNWVGGNDYNPCGADFVPPPPEELERALNDLCQALAEEDFSPIVQAALIHAQFETIHPFMDGNGRTGRALIHVVLRRRGMAMNYVPPISVILASDRGRYILGLEAFRSDDVESWVEQFAVAAKRSADLAAAYLGAIEALMSQWRRKLSEGAAPRSDAAAWALIDVLPAYPVISSTTAVAATRRAKSAVHQGIEQLVECRVLKPVSTSKRNRSWEAVGLLDLLEGLEGGEVPLASDDAV